MCLVYRMLCFGFVVIRRKGYYVAATTHWLCLHLSAGLKRIDADRVRAEKAGFAIEGQ